MYLGRLNSNGSLDDTFTADAGNSVLPLAAQFDGKLGVGGSSRPSVVWPQPINSRSNGVLTRDQGDST